MSGIASGDGQPIRRRILRIVRKPAAPDSVAEIGAMESIAAVAAEPEKLESPAAAPAAEKKRRGPISKKVDSDSVNDQLLKKAAALESRFVKYCEQRAAQACSLVCFAARCDLAIDFDIANCCRCWTHMHCPCAISG